VQAAKRAKILPNLAFHREMVARQSQPDTSVVLDVDRERLARLEHTKESEDNGD
jgi:hypothetical protein